MGSSPRATATHTPNASAVTSRTARATADGCFGTWFVCTAAQAEACCWPFLSRASTLHSLALTQRVMPPGPGRMAGRANLASQALTRRCRVHLSCSRAPFPARAPEWLD
eukprot:2659872-Rhodomonas_salina.1